MKYGAAVGGVVLVIAGLALLGAGLFDIAGGPAYSECIGDGCLDDVSVLGFPVGIVAMVVGMILAGWGLSAIRSERGSTGPWSAFGFMTGLGLLFLAMGWLFLLAVRQASSSDGGADGALLFVGLLFIVMGLAFAGSDLWRARSIARAGRLRTSGLRGTATVVGVGDSGWTLNNNPMVNLDLEVHMPGEAPFRTRQRTVLSRLSVGALIPGSVLAVLADPKSPTKVTIDWDAAGGSAGDGTAFDGAQFAGRSGQALGGPINAGLLRMVSQALSAAADRASTGQPSDGAPTLIVNGQVVDLSDRRLTGQGADASRPGSAGLTLPIVIAGTATGIDSTTTSLPPAGQAEPIGLSSTAMAVSGPDAGLPMSAGSQGSGVTGRVTLDSIQRTGVEMSGSQLYAFGLTVLVPGQPSYQINHAALVAPGLVPRLVQGASFPAIIDPGQKSQLVVEWDR